MLKADIERYQKWLLTDEGKQHAARSAAVSACKLTTEEGDDKLTTEEEEWQISRIEACISILPDMAQLATRRTTAT